MPGLENWFGIGVRASLDHIQSDEQSEIK